MAHLKEEEQDAMTEEELTGRATSPSTSTPPPSKPKDAFSELMSPKPKRKPPSPPPDTTSSKPASKKPTPSPPTDPRTLNARLGRDALSAYTTSPTLYPSVVLYHTPAFVAVRDAYPKSTVHLLLLPRDPALSTTHPLTAFSDPAVLSSVRTEAAKLKRLAAAELRRLLSPYSALDAARNAALKADPPPDELPPGRDWEADVVAGVHARPSMNALHVHVLSVDRRSEAMKHRKHYNSFATGFFVPLEEFPLSGQEVKSRMEGGWLAGELRCWRCGKGFGNRFARLKEHLEVEFEAWRAE